MDNLAYVSSETDGRFAFAARGVAASSEHEHLIRADERRRIGRELHDSTAQLLVALQLKLAGMKHMGGAGPGLHEADTVIADIHRQIRSICSCAGTATWNEGDLPSALKSMAADFAELTGLNIEVRLEGGYAARPAELEIALYRIAQEALANVHRHAEARKAVVRLRSHGRSLRLTVTDDGIGIGNPPRLGIGLQSMRQRARELGAHFCIAQLDVGTEVSVSLG